MRERSRRRCERGASAAATAASSSLRLIERLGFRPLAESPGAFGVIRWYEKAAPEEGDPA